jgi:hypothetical protein
MTYWVCTTSQSESTFSNAMFERAVKVRATFRNVTTIARLTAGCFGETVSPEGAGTAGSG